MSVLEHGTIEVNGRIGGRDVTLTGNVKNLAVKKVETDYRASSWTMDKIGPRDRYYIEFDDDDSGNQFYLKYSEKIPDLGEVMRTARVQAPDRTAAAIEKARRAVGAPENAKFRFDDFQQMGGGLVIENLDNATPVWVEFRWKD